MEGPKAKRTRRGGVRVNTKKIVDKLTYNPMHKQKMTKKLRQKLALQPTPPTKAPPALKTSSTIGSININGMDIEANWAVGQLLKKHDFDVSKLKICLKINI